MRVANAMQNGMAFIDSVQLSDGGFESFSSPHADPFNPDRTYLTTFAPALILGALSRVDDPVAKKVNRTLAAWLLSQKSPSWSFNYWASAAPERTTLPYPDDLDDTFCSLVALHSHEPSTIDAACLAHVVKLLVATEREVGGPYKTWLTADEAPAWQDVDLAVNANIAALLRLVAEPLPNLTKLMETAIKKRAFTSPYYPSAYPIVYYLARAYEGQQSGALIRYLLSKQKKGCWETPLHTALAVASLTRLGRIDACQDGIDYLLKQQLSDGSWPATAFCLDPAIQNQSYYSGSPALTTAFALEALASTQAVDETKNRAITSAKPQSSLYGHVLESVHEEVGRLSQPIRHEMLRIIDHTAKGDIDHEIVLLPELFSKSLKSVASITDQHLLELGAANLYGWTAYTIYDNFLDNEGQPGQLSAANVALRYSLRRFKQALPDDTGFHTAVDEAYDTIDNANTWEMQQCRAVVTDKKITIGHLPGYPSSLGLADRSVGHTLGPLGVLAAQGVAVNDPRTKKIRLALRHYLVARQLNDDLHDWEQDVRAGIITYVVARILRDLLVQPGHYTFTKLIPKMQQQFWHHTLPTVCAVASKHTLQARQAASSSNLLQETNIITSLTSTIDASLTTTLAEQNKAETFLATYSKTDQ